MEIKIYINWICDRKYPKPSSEVDPLIEFEYLQGFDPWEYDLMLVIDEVDKTWNIDLAYLSRAIEVGQATEIAADFTAVLDFMLAHSQESVGSALGSLRKRI